MAEFFPLREIYVTTKFKKGHAEDPKVNDQFQSNLHSRKCSGLSPESERHNFVNEKNCSAADALLSATEKIGEDIDENKFVPAASNKNNALSFKFLYESRKNLERNAFRIN